MVSCSFERPVRTACSSDLSMEWRDPAGTNVYAVPDHHGWLEIDTVADFVRATATFEESSVALFVDPAGAPKLSQKK